MARFRCSILVIICGFTTLGKRGFVGMSAAGTVRAYRPYGGSHAKAHPSSDRLRGSLRSGDTTSDSAAHNVHRLACRASGPLHQMPAAASRLRRDAPFGQKKRRSRNTFSDQTRKEERTTWESIEKTGRTSAGTKWRGEAFRASDVAARRGTPPRGGLCGLRNPK